jgi:hypothetical protein
MNQLLSNILKLAAGAALALTLSTQALAFPDRVREQEILKVDLPGLIPTSELGVVVVMPASCAGVEVSLLCQQFRDFKPRPQDPYAYAALEGLGRSRSIAGQVQALPAAQRERRFVMIVDWAYATQRSKSWDLFYLNGEVAVYDQRERKVVWHAIALQDSIKTEQSFAKAAGDYIYYKAVLGPLLYARTMESAGGKGFVMQSVTSTQQAGAGSLVIFNERGKFDDRPGEGSVNVSIERLPKQPGVYAFSVNLPLHSYLALSVPPGRYRINHAHKAEIEVDVLTGQRLAHELSYGFYNSSRIAEVSGENFAKLSVASRNFLLPDLVARNRYSGALAWSDIAPGDEPVLVPASAAVPDAAPAAARPANRTDRATARVRFLGNIGVKIDFYENRMCFRGDATGTDVSGADAGSWAWVKGKSESVSVGMPDTDASLAIKAKAKGKRSYYREFEIAAGKPVSVGMTDSFQTFGANAGTTSCTSGRSFIPAAGADYEASFVWSDGGCTLKVAELSVEQEQVRQLPVELARVPECRGTAR